MVQSAKNWRRYNATESLNGTGKRRVFVQGQMRANAIVIFAM
jgi:hypothetical protein